MNLVNQSLKFFGLLHLAESEKSAVNLRTDSFNSQIEVYLRNASLLSKSLDKNGLQFELLTNKKLELNQLCTKLNINLITKEIPFETKIPSGTSFYSAHYKIDVFRYISSLEIDYALYCDLDVVCLKPAPLVFDNLIKFRIPLVYEITDQIISDSNHLQLIQLIEFMGVPGSEGRWIGGEFVSGDPAFFKKLVQQIDEVYPRYIEKLNAFENRISGNDEVFLTAAIENLRRTGTYVGEAGNLNVIGRYWSSGVNHIQKPFKHFENLFLLHLPANKNFLQRLEQDSIEFDSKTFLKSYKKMLLKTNSQKFMRNCVYFLYKLKTKIWFIRSVTSNKFL